MVVWSASRPRSRSSSSTSRNESEYRRYQRTAHTNQLGLGLSPLEDRRSDCLLHDLFRLPAAVGQSCNTTFRGQGSSTAISGGRLPPEAVDYSAGQRVPKDHPLRAIRTLVDARPLFRVLPSTESVAPRRWAGLPSREYSIDHREDIERAPRRASGPRESHKPTHGAHTPGAGGCKTRR